MPNQMPAMIKKWHVRIEFKWFDIWLGVFIDQPGKAIYICLLPTLPIKIWFTEHKTCTTCGALLNKVAVDTGDGWLLTWECKECGCDEDDFIDWPFGEEALSVNDLIRRGYEVV